MLYYFSQTYWIGAKVEFEIDQFLEVQKYGPPHYDQLLAHLKASFTVTWFLCV